MHFELTILSGNRRGQTLRLDRSRLTLGGAADCDLRFENDTGVEALHAEIVEENCQLYLRKISPEGVLLLNQLQVSELILQDQDLIGLGEFGPRIRLRLPAEKYRECKPVFQICRDCIEMLKLADLPVHRKAGLLLRQMGHDLLHQTTPVFKVFTLLLFLGLGAALGGYTWWNQRQFQSYERALARLGEQSQRERRSLVERLRTLQQESAQTAAEQEQLSRLKDSLESRSEATVRRLEDEIQNLRQEVAFAPPLVARYSGGVCFILGGYGFVERASGRMLRFAGFDSEGNPLQDSSGRIRLQAAEEGVPLSRFYTGSGFLVSQDGHVVTNRHVAEPWSQDEMAQEIAHNGFDPKWIVFHAYFPGHKTGYPLKVLRHSDRADVSVLKGNFGKSRPPLLSLSRSKARPGEPVLLLGYPTGYDALLARYSTQTIESLISENPSSLEDLALSLARRNLIRPIATQGHLGDVLTDRLVYDAQTAHGGSGGPVLNARGEVIGVNFATLAGFGGSNFGVPAELIRPLVPVSHAGPHKR